MILTRFISSDKVGYGNAMKAKARPLTNKINALYSQGIDKQSIAKELNTSVKEVDRALERGFLEEKMIPIEEISKTSNVKVLRQCDMCGKVEEVRWIHVNKRYDPLKEPTYCVKCSVKSERHRKSMHDAQMKYNWMRGKTKRTIVQCSTCGKEVSIIASRKKSYKSWYCSTECQQKSLIVERIDSICSFCGSQFERSPSQIKWAKIRGRGLTFCSHKCYSSFYTGTNNPFWKEGTSMKRRERAEFKKRCLKIIFERDNYTCRLCGERGGKLHVHHLFPWAQSKSLRFEPVNLITVCKHCHIEVCHKGNFHELDWDLSRKLFVDNLVD